MSAPVGEGELVEVDRPLLAHQAVDPLPVEHHPRAVELGEAGLEGAAHAQPLEAEVRSAGRLEAEGDQAHRVALADPEAARQLGAEEGAGNAVRVDRELRGRGAELAAAGIDAAQRHLARPGGRPRRRPAAPAAPVRPSPGAAASVPWP